MASVGGFVNAARTAPKRKLEDIPEWHGFADGAWRTHIDVADFIRCNVQPYTGNARFLSPATARTMRLWNKLAELFELERAVGVVDVSQLPSSLTAHAPGYIDRDLEIIVGLQTDAPLKRAVYPHGCYRVIARTLEAHGYGIDPSLREYFGGHRKTHNDGVLDAYPAEVLAARANHVVMGLPEAHGRGRAIGDYRRVALYGVSRLISQKQIERASLDVEPSSEVVIREREELAEQLRALRQLLLMAQAYGYDISRPARNAREAVQWLYFAYLGALKEQDGTAMALGRVSTFLDVYFSRDEARGALGEAQLQELVDDLVIKLRLVRFLRSPEHDQLHAADPTWLTEAIGGIADDGRPLVTRTSYRFLQTLYNLGPAPEPNLTVLWSPELPQDFKRFCARSSLETSCIQYVSDALLRKYHGDDAAIACAVSSVRMGKQVQHFGGCINLAKCLLYAINGGRDELTGQQVMPPFDPVAGDLLEIEDVLRRMEHAMSWLARTIVSASNCVHYMHDRYAYERLAMALHDHSPLRTMAFGIVGLSVAADSLSAIEHARVKVVRDASGLVVGYHTSGEFPTFGNDDDRVDNYARKLVERFMGKLRQQPTYRDAIVTQSVLTLTSSAASGKQTGSTPDGRAQGEPLSPDQNQMQGRDQRELVAAASSVSKVRYADCQDGISFTANLSPGSLGETRDEQSRNLLDALDHLFDRGLFHINVNVLSRETLVDAMTHPERYPDLAVRVSGHAVPFTQLTHEQQRDVIAHTFDGGA